MNRHGMQRTDNGWQWTGENNVMRYRRAAMMAEPWKMGVDTPMFVGASNVTIQLYEKDTFNFDDLLATVHTNDKGYFEITGRESEFGLLRPYLYVTHQCPSVFPEYKNCKFTTRMDIPHNKKDTHHEVVMPLGVSFTKVICD
jgi:hypothetical protein